MPSHRFAAPPLPKMRGISGTPYLQEDEPKAKSDWLSATAKGDKYQCAFHYRTSIPYGKGKDNDGSKSYSMVLYQFPMGKVKTKDPEVSTNAFGNVSIPYGKGKAEESFWIHIKAFQVSIPYGKGKEQYFVFILYYNRQI